MTKTARDILLALTDPDTYWLSEADRISGINQALKELEAIVAEQVIGSDRMMPSGSHSAGKSFAVFSNQLRADQRQALRQALYGEEK